MLEIFLGSSIVSFAIVYGILELLFGKPDHNNHNKRHWRPNKEWQKILDEFGDWFKEY